MNSLIKIIVILTIHKLTGTSNILENNNVRLNLEYLCPGIDICNPNQPDSLVNSNAIYNGDKASCCHGCSCHINCHLSLNCCFPKDNGNVTNSQISPFDSGKPSLDEDTFHINTENESASGNIPPIGNRTMRVNKNSTFGSGFYLRTPVDRQYNISDDKPRTHIDIDQPVQQQCVYARTGTPEENWVKHELAYRMVTVPPARGCNASTACKSLTKHRKHAACDSNAVAPWGDLFPVYSAEHGLIYKNALCACCHGVSDYEVWTTLLVCDEFDVHKSRGIAYAEHFNKFSNHCFVLFHHGVTQTIQDHRCFVDTIDQCQLSSTSSLFFVPVNVSLSRSEIVTACFNGPYAPIKQRGQVYKNVFCLICSDVSMFIFFPCYDGYDSDGKRSMFVDKTYLIDTTSIMMHTPGVKKTRIAPYPTACLKTNTGWIEESCRVTECPIGQGRNEDGICKMLYKTWFRLNSVLVKLKYITSNTSILPILNKDEVCRNCIKNAFQRSKPWQSGWVIGGIYHTSEDNKDGPLVAVELNTQMSLTEMLLTKINLSLRSNWNITLDGLHIAFEQSLMEYTLVTTAGGKAPRWTNYVNKTVSLVNVPNTQTVYWESFLADLILMHMPFQVTKLLSCEQISLFEDEFILMTGGFILVNKLTNKTMFDREFELDEDENGNLVPIVCLADTPFVLRNVNSSAQPMSNTLLHLALIIYIVQWAVDLCNVQF